jgi:hypothetical protein
MTLTARERTLRARLGAYSLHAKRDARETTAQARTRFLERFVLEVDPKGKLGPKERARRATAARSAYFARLALRSARARKKSTSRPRQAARARQGVSRDGNRSHIAATDRV